VHADRHGAVVIPPDVAARLPEAAAEIAAAERRIIDASQRGDFDVETLARLLGGDAGH
jgi:regulator of RNase E activity RraA